MRPTTRTLLALTAAVLAVSPAAAQPTPLPAPDDLGTIELGPQGTPQFEPAPPGGLPAPPSVQPLPPAEPLGTAQPHAAQPHSIPPNGSPYQSPYPTPSPQPHAPFAGSIGGDHLPPPQRQTVLVPVEPPPALLLPTVAPTIDDYSWILIEKPRPRPIRVHDLITVTVDDKNEVFVDNRFNRSRISQIKAELKEFIRLKDGRIENAAANSPTIDANLQSRLNSSGQIQASEGIKSIVTASVVDIQPNGNLVLEAKKEVRTNRDVWEYRLTGVIRPEKISRDFTALSEDLAELKIEKKQNGKVHHSTKRPWGVVLYDLLSPF